MRINSDHYGQIPAPSFILCRASGERIGSIPCTQKKMQQNFNTYDEISFTISTRTTKKTACTTRSAN